MTGLRQMHRIATQPRLPTAEDKTSKRRPFAAATLGALAAALLLGLAPQDGLAQACKAKGIKPKTGCVTSSDIEIKTKGKKRRPVLNQKWRRDEAGVAFNQPPAVSKRVEVLNGPVADLPVFTTVSMRAPAPGWIVVTANAVLESLVTQANLDVNGVVDCELQFSGPLFNVQIPVAQDFFFGAIDTADGIATDTMQNLHVMELDEALFTGKAPADRVFSVDLACGLVNALGVGTNANIDARRQILMRPPRLTVQYFPTRYCPRKRDGSCR